MEGVEEISWPPRDPQAINQMEKVYAYLSFDQNMSISTVLYIVYNLLFRTRGGYLLFVIIVSRVLMISIY